MMLLVTTSGQIKILLESFFKILQALLGRIWGPCVQVKSLSRLEFNYKRVENAHLCVFGAVEKHMTTITYNK